MVDVDMGYGHQRTAFPLKHLAPGGKIINANSYQRIPEKDRKIWEASRIFYEFISRFKRVPFVGGLIFSTYDKFQKIHPFYPKRDLSKPNFSLKRICSLIKKGWGKHLVERLKKKPLPLITTFFIPAFMAEIHGYPGEIYCAICDADISRTWAPLNPKESKIKYFAPNQRVVGRLKLYGVKRENILLTGYPLPKENLGSKNMEIARKDLARRIPNLDLHSQYRYRYRSLIKKYLGDLPRESDHPLTIMFAVGGAGAQKEIGIKIVESLAKKIRAGEVKIILVAGIRERVKEYFKEEINRGLSSADLGKFVEILYQKKIKDYFREFNQKLRKTDILWTKPSELSFYTGLGLPMIIAPPIGSQEDFNKEWLLEVGSAISQKNPKYTNEWLFDLLGTGWFAEAAMQGFVESPNMGTFNIEKVVTGKIHLPF